MLERRELNTVRRESVQDVPVYEQDGMGIGLGGYLGTDYRGPFLPPWGTRERERALRWLYRNQFNWLGQAAFSGFIKKMCASPWEIKGKRGVKYYQEMLRNAQFGAGWDNFLSLVILDFLRSDTGAFIEVIGPGDSDTRLNAQPTGLAHLDPLYCFPTGDPEMPVVYFSRLGSYHAIHYTRLLRLIDTPDGDQLRFNQYGLCALSRAVSIVYQSIYASQYTVQKLDDRPAPGIVVASNINQATVDAAFQNYERQQQNDERPVWGKNAWMYNLDPSAPAKVEQITFSQAPEGWSYREYTELQVNAFAAALGVDVQEIWQLTGGNLGSGQQSEILHAKSQGKLYGYLLTQIERQLNNILPENLEFSFKARDPYQQQAEATTAQAWASFVGLLGATASDDEKRLILASNVPAFHDAVTDSKGEIVSLTDADVHPEDDRVDVVADDDTPLDPDGETAPEDQTIVEGMRSHAGVKAIQATRLDFEGDFEDLLAAARDGQVNRRRFGIILRDLIRRYGRQAYIDGKADGGVMEAELDDDEQVEFAAELAEQSMYVTNFGGVLYDSGISDAQAAEKPAMWFGKSVLPFYQRGLASADRNGMYEWVLGEAEHCTTCLTLNGQRHRMSWFVRRKFLPRSSALECKGFNCKCTLVKTTERARGAEKAVLLHIHKHED